MCLGFHIGVLGNRCVRNVWQTEPIVRLQTSKGPRPGVRLRSHRVARALQESDNHFTRSCRASTFG
eukprot:5985380-Pyramimonas_sp.AAC.1